MQKKAGGVGLREMEEALERARKSIELAEKLIDTDLAASANRIYNAGENLGIAVMLSTSKVVPKSHGKIWNMVHNLYQKGILKSDYRSLLESSYKLRIKGDYGRDLEGEAIVISREILREHINSLKAFLKEAEELTKRE